MRKLMQSFLAATTALSLAPTAAMARPPFCDEICGPIFDCSQQCIVTMDPRVDSTCGEYYGLCIAPQQEPTELTSSVSRDEARQPDGQPRVCGEEQQSVES